MTVAENRIQTQRGTAAGQRPTAGNRRPGQLFVNWYDRQLSVVDNTQTPLDLVGVRFFSTASAYVAGDYVVQAGNAYRAKTSVAAGAFNVSQWDKIATIPDITAATSGIYLPLAGGGLSGPVGSYMQPPAGTTNAFVTAAPVTSGTFVFNAYAAPGGTGWKALGAGRAALIDYNVTNGIINFYQTAPAAANGAVTPVAIATLDAGGNLIANGGITAAQNLVGRVATYPSYNAATDFILYVSGVTRLLQWSGNWYDGWNSTNGMRNWTGTDGTNVWNCMTLDGSGNLVTRGQVQAGGAVVSASTVQGANLQASVGSTWGTITGGYVHSTGNVQADGSFTASLDVTANRNLGVIGAASIGGSLNVNGNLSVGGTLSLGALTVTTATTNTVYYDNFVSETFYGHSYSIGWNGKGTRHRVDGGDQGYWPRSPNMFQMNFVGNAVTGLWDGGSFAWTAYSAATFEEAQAKADEAMADVATIKDLHATVEALVARIAVLEQRLAGA